MVDEDCAATPVGTIASYGATKCYGFDDEWKVAPRRHRKRLPIVVELELAKIFGEVLLLAGSKGERGGVGEARVHVEARN